MTNSKRGGRSTALRPGTGGEGGKGGDSPNSERRKGEKGAGKSDGKKGAVKGSGKGKKGEGKNTTPSPPQERHVAGAKTVQELEAEMLSSKVGAGASTKERREAMKHPLEAKGHYCEVKKHSDMGCAVVSFKDQACRNSVMALATEKAIKANAAKPKAEQTDDDRPSLKVSGVDVQLRPHFDKAAQEEIKHDIFVAWGRQEEKKANLPAQIIAEAIDLLVIETRGGHLGAENGTIGSPLLAPGPPLAHMNGLGAAPMQTMPHMQLPQPLQQMLQQPMIPGHQQQQQQVNYADFIQYAWAAQQQQQQALAAQQHAAAQQQQQQQMHPPLSPQHAPSTAPSLGQLETPPRGPGGALKMRAGAAEFTPPPVQEPQFNYDQSQYVINELEQYAGFDYNQIGQQVPNKSFQIVDPKNGQVVEMQAQKTTWPGFEVPQLPGRKPIKIVDPNSGDTVDTLGMIFKPAAAAKSFTIVDPKSGGNIKV